MYEEIEKLPPDAKEWAFAQLSIDGGILGLRADEILKLYEEAVKMRLATEESARKSQEVSSRSEIELVAGDGCPPIGDMTQIQEERQTENVSNVAVTNITTAVNVQTVPNSDSGPINDASSNTSRDPGPYIGIGCLGFMVLFLIFAVRACKQNSIYEPVGEKNIADVTRIFMHTPKRYTFMVEESDSKELNQLSLEVNSYGGGHRPYGEDNLLDVRENGQVKIFKDVAADKQMWVKVKFAKTLADSSRPIDEYLFNNRNIYYMEIHIRSEEDIGGGEWSERRGKTTVTGQTEVLK